MAPIRRLVELELIVGWLMMTPNFVLQKSGSTRTNSASTRSASPTSCLWPGRGFCKDFPPSGGPGKSESQDCEDKSFLKNALQKVKSSFEWCALESWDPGPWTLMKKEAQVSTAVWMIGSSFNSRWRGPPFVIFSRLERQREANLAQTPVTAWEICREESEQYSGLGVIAVPRLQEYFRQC